jgi:hypothetical protein
MHRQFPRCNGTGTQLSRRVCHCAYVSVSTDPSHKQQASTDGSVQQQGSSQQEPSGAGGEGVPRPLPPVEAGDDDVNLPRWQHPPHQEPRGPRRLVSGGVWWRS